MLEVNKNHYLLGFGISLESFMFCFSTQNDCRIQPDESQRPSIIVSNHVSYLDILYHMSAYFPSFVAKVGALFNNINESDFITTPLF